MTRKQSLIRVRDIVSFFSFPRVIFKNISQRIIKGNDFDEPTPVPITQGTGHRLSPSQIVLGKEVQVGN